MSSLGKRTRGNQASAAPAPTTPAKRRIIQLVTPETTPTKLSGLRVTGLKRTPSSSAGSPYSPAKSMLRRNAVAPVVGRDLERDALRAFLGNDQQPLLYVCGPPGTGKSATVTAWSASLSTTSFQVVALNCVALQKPELLYATVLGQLDKTSVLAATQTPTAARSNLQAHLKARNLAAPVLLILDEMDYLSTGTSLDVLYSLFELADGKRLRIIGIANALNLTETLLPHLHQAGLSPAVLRFTPYTPLQITAILTARLEAAREKQADAAPVVEQTALLLLGRKVANATGDIRKALDILRRAVELVEAEQAPANILTERSPNASLSQESSDAKTGKTLARVTLKHVAQAATQALSQGLATAAQLRLLSLHELACLCTLAAVKPATLGETHAAYTRLCKKDKLMSALGRTEFFGVCEALMDRGLLAVPRGQATVARNGRLAQSQADRGVLLAVAEMEVLQAVSELGVLRRFFE